MEKKNEANDKAALSDGALREVGGGTNRRPVIAAVNNPKHNDRNTILAMEGGCAEKAAATGSPFIPKDTENYDWSTPTEE